MLTRIPKTDKKIKNPLVLYTSLHPLPRTPRQHGPSLARGGEREREFEVIQSPWMSHREDPKGAISRVRYCSPMAGKKWRLLHLPQFLRGGPGELPSPTSANGIEERSRRKSRRSTQASSPNVDSRSLTSSNIHHVSPVGTTSASRPTQSSTYTKWLSDLPVRVDFSLLEGNFSWLTS